MEYKLNDYHYNIPDQELLDDVKRTALKLGKNNLTFRDYDEAGKYTTGTIVRRFGKWNQALQKAGLETVQDQNLNVSDKELFENIEKAWISLGRQPKFREMRLSQSFSKYSTDRYINKFGTWRKALEAFVEFINSDSCKDNEPEPDENVSETFLENEIIFKHKTKRTPGERLKVQVLMRDGNKCRLCGITVMGENIHFDHILAWSKGGETVLENLQVLCAEHNLAKGNVEYEAK